MFKTEGDVMLFVVGGAEENEILLFSVVLCLRDSLSILLKYVFLSFLCFPVRIFVLGSWLWKGGPNGSGHG